MSRRLLLAIVSAMKWVLYPFVFLYHSLLPKTKKNKGRFKTIYGNGVIENQLLANGNFENGSGWNRWLSSITFTISNHIAKAVMVSPSGGAFDGFYRQRNVQLNHLYLVKFKARSSTGNTMRVSMINNNSLYMKTADFDLTNSFKDYSVIFNINSSSTYTSVSYINFAFLSSAVAGNEFEVMEVNFIDLTLMFGTGNEPTSISDNRIQNIINGGYIPYNEGEYKCTSIKALVSEPYNLFDEQTETGQYDTITGEPQINTSRLRNKNDVALLGNKTYTMELGSQSSTVSMWACLLDKNKNIISGNAWTGGTGSISSNFHELVSNNSLVNTFTTPQNARYMRFYLTNNYGTTYKNDICFHRTGTRTGYASHPAILPREYQQVEYIESHGTEYIDTGVIGKGSIKAELEVSFPNQSSNQTCCFGARLDANTRFLIFTGNTPQTIQADYETAQPFVSLSTPVSGLDFRQTTHLSLSNKLIINGTQVGNTLTQSSFDTTLPIYLFSINNAGSPMFSYMGTMRLPFAKLYDNGILVRAFVPCYRKSDGVIGVYDLVNDVFYTNAGTGTFGKGNDIKNPTEITLPKSLDLDGAINSHNTLTETPTAYVFTRNVWHYTFTGSETLQEQGTSTTNKYRYRITWLSSSVKSVSSNADIGNLLMTNYTTLPANTSGTYGCNNGVSVNTSAYIDIYNENYSATGSGSSLLATLVGKTVYYELATPQTITIPKKRLGCVDLGSLSGNIFDGGTQYERYVITISGIKTFSASSQPNLYCNNFITTTDDNVYLHTKNNSIGSHNGVVQIYSKDFIGKTASEIKSLLSGTILYYETASEVEDIDNLIYVEEGGTLNGLENYGVENQIITNGDFSNGTTGWAFESCTQSVSNNKLTLVRNNVSVRMTASQTKNIVGNHKYFLHEIIKVVSQTANTTIILTDVNGKLSAHDMTLVQTAVQGQTYNIQTIITSAGTGSSTIRFFRISTGNLNDSYELSNLMLIDLTQWFGAGNEPTSVEDPRIKEIITKGYVPYNTGTYVEKTCKVLPNVDMEIL